MSAKFPRGGGGYDHLADSLPRTPLLYSKTGVCKGTYYFFSLCVSDVNEWMFVLNVISFKLLTPQNLF